MSIQKNKNIYKNKKNIKNKKAGLQVRRVICLFVRLSYLVRNFIVSKTASIIAGIINGKII